MKDYCVYCMQPSDEDKCPHCGKSASSYHAETHQLQPGTILNSKYLVGAVLGEGGFGITYVGRDITLDMKIAVKEYFPNGVVNRNNTYSSELTKNGGQMGAYFEKGKICFLTEARTLAKFASEQNCVAVRDFFEGNNTAYIVMEYLEGSDLKDYLIKHGKFSFENVCSLLIPVMKVLNKVHSQGLIHRDISPANIMVLSSGTAKLLDFGAARDVSGDSEKSLSIMLKPGYAPEEQYRTKGKQGPWTDVYALSATIYKILTDVTPEDSMNRVFEENLEPISKYNPSITPAQEAVVMKGMSVRMEERYQTMNEMIAAYLNCLNMPSKMLSEPERLMNDKIISDNMPKIQKKTNKGKKIIPILVAAFLLIISAIMVPLIRFKNTVFEKIENNSIQNQRVFSAEGKAITTNELNELLNYECLQILYLKNCELTNEHLNIIAQLPDLIYLDISGNYNITDISPLNNLSKLKELEVNDIPDLEVSKLTNPNIEKLNCAGCNLTDISFVSSFSENLQKLDCSRNKITDISLLDSLVNLESSYIDLSNNEISDISCFSECEGPNYLYLSGNRISDITALYGHSKILHLDISNNQITDILALIDCFNITNLNISYNYIEDIEAVEGITDLEYFKFDHNRIQSVASLNTLNNLKAMSVVGVDASYNCLISTEGLEAFWKNSSPETLNISHNLLRDISTLTGCDSIKHFNANDNRLSDDALNIISSFSNLTSLNLIDNGFTSYVNLLESSNFHPDSVNMKISYRADIDYEALNNEFRYLTIFNADSERIEDTLTDMGIIYGGISSQYYDDNEPGRIEWFEKIETENILDTSDEITGGVTIDIETIDVEFDKPNLEN